MITKSVILDIVLVAIMVICIIIGKKRGLFRTLAELLSYVVAWVAASVLASAAAVYVSAWLRPQVEAILRKVTADVMKDVVETAVQKLPAFLQGDSLSASLYDLVMEGLEIDFGPYIESALRNIAYTIAFVLLFVGVMVVLRLVIKALDILTKLPVIHKLNDVGGIFAGAIKGFVLILVLLWLAGETGYLVSPEAAAGSYIVPYLQGILSSL